MTCYPNPPIRREYIVHSNYDIDKLKILIANDTGYQLDIFDILLSNLQILKDTELHNVFVLHKNNVVYVMRNATYENSPARFFETKFASNEPTIDLPDNGLPDIDLPEISNDDNIETKTTECLCVACNERQYNILFLNCCHVCICEKCYIESQPKNCCICRAVIVHILKIFLV